MNYEHGFVAQRERIKRLERERDEIWKPLLEAAKTVTEADPLPWAKLKKTIAVCEALK